MLRTKSNCKLIFFIIHFSFFLFFIVLYKKKDNSHFTPEVIFPILCSRSSLSMSKRLSIVWLCPQLMRIYKLDDWSTSSLILCSQWQIQVRLNQPALKQRCTHMYTHAWKIKNKKLWKSETKRSVFFYLILGRAHIVERWWPNETYAYMHGSFDPFR